MFRSIRLISIISNSNNMSIFKRKKEREYESEEEELEELDVRDLKPENKRKRKEPPKPWGKKERYTVLFFLLATVLTSGILAASSRNWKLPGLPQISIPKFPAWNLNFLNGQTITIGPGKKQTDSDQIKKARIIEKEFGKRTKPLSGLYAFYVVDLENEYSFGTGEHEILTAASLIKLPVLAAIYMEAEKGNLNLDDKPKGSSLTFRELAREMGKKSNNQAQITVANALGRDKIQSVIEVIGMTKTSYAENETTAYDIGLFFQKLWANQIVTEEFRDEILGYLTDTIYENWLKKGIPEVRVAHKYGREVHVISDAGIVFAPKPFILVIMSQGVVDAETDAFIPEFAAFVFKER